MYHCLSLNKTHVTHVLGDTYSNIQSKVVALQVFATCVHCDTVLADVAWILFPFPAGLPFINLLRQWNIPHLQSTVHFWVICLKGSPSFEHLLVYPESFLLAKVALSQVVPTQCQSNDQYLAILGPCISGHWFSLDVTSKSDKLWICRRKCSGNGAILFSIYFSIVVGGSNPSKKMRHWGS